MIKKLKLTSISLWFLACIAFVIFKGVVPAWEGGRTDFSNYYASAKLITTGESIADFYNNDWFFEKATQVGVSEGAKFSPFPPATAFLYLPLTAFSPLMAKKIWTVFNLFLLGLIVFQAKKSSKLSLLNTGLVISIFFIPIASNIRFGQSYLLFTSLIFGFLNWTKSRKFLAAGSALGVAAVFKYLPLLYLIYVAPKVNRKLVFSFFGSIIIITLLPIIVNGFEPYLAFEDELFNHINGNLSEQGQHSYYFQSIDAFLANLFIYDLGENPDVLVNLPILKTIFKAIFIGVIVFLSSKTFLNKQDKKKEISSAICLVGAFLIVPASATYHFLLMIPVLLLLFKFALDQNKIPHMAKIIIAITFVISNISPYHIPTIEFNHSIDTLCHFPRLFGLIALFIYLLVIQKRYLETNG